MRRKIVSFVRMFNKQQMKHITDVKLKQEYFGNKAIVKIFLFYVYTKPLFFVQYENNI